MRKWSNIDFIESIIHLISFCFLSSLGSPSCFGPYGVLWSFGCPSFKLSAHTEDSSVDSSASIFGSSRHDELRFRNLRHYQLSCEQCIAVSSHSYLASFGICGHCLFSLAPFSRWTFLRTRLGSMNHIHILLWSSYPSFLNSRRWSPSLSFPSLRQSYRHLCGIGFSCCWISK